MSPNINKETYLIEWLSHSGIPPTLKSVNSSVEGESSERNYHQVLDIRSLSYGDVFPIYKKLFQMWIVICTINKSILVPST